MDKEIINQMVENYNFRSDELAELDEDDYEDWGSLVEEDVEEIAKMHAEMKATRKRSEEMFEYLRQIKEREKRHKELLQEMPDKII